MKTKIFRQWNGSDVDKREFYRNYETSFFYTIDRLNGVVGIRGCTKDDTDVVAVSRKDFERFGERRVLEFLREHLTLNEDELQYLMKFIKKDLMQELADTFKIKVVVQTKKEITEFEPK